MIPSFSDKPEKLGIVDGKFFPCPDFPNCVSSQETDEEHKIEPIKFENENPISQLEKVISSFPKTTILTKTENYIYAEFQTFLMNYIDDVEFYIDFENKLIHVKSFSRLGKSDLGANRKRVEEIKNKFKNGI
ncbi:MAG: DUF1499 domain-containing protein [Calditrichaeota bacterium]|nr:MAG: DUF1499 domain-containing protein [Calditrichota bacterium]